MNSFVMDDLVNTELIRNLVIPYRYYESELNTFYKRYEPFFFNPSEVRF